MEIFKEVIGYPEYEISNCGRVRSKARMIRYVHAVTKKEHFRLTSEKYLKLFTTVHGYYFVSLRKNNKPVSLNIHRLVALNFIENPDNLPVVNHKDGNKLNNTVENLEWCTDAYNHHHATVNGLKPKGSKIGTSKLNERCIFAINKLLQKGLTHKEIGEIFNVNRSTISQIAEGIAWKHALTSQELQIEL